jgi:lysozyme family protein
MTNFDYAFPFILLHEGGWCHTTGDSGGETFKGISRNNFPKWAGWAIIDVAKASPNFPRSLMSNASLSALVADFYLHNFWQQSWDGLDKRVAAKVMDCSVNMGMAWGPKLLQRALCVTDDGIIGPATLAAANGTDTDRLLNEMVTVIDHHYEQIVEANPVDQKFLDGWEKRASWIPA